MATRFRHAGRWLLAAVIVVSLHAMALTALLLNWQPATAVAETAPMTVTLAMQASSSESHSQPEVAPSVPNTPPPKSAPKAITKPALKPKPRPKPTPKPKPKPKPKHKPTPKPPKLKPVAPQPRQQHLDAAKAERTQAKRRGSSEQLKNAKQRWYGLVLALLQKHKRYPRLALLRGQQGTAKVRFVLNRSGRVLRVELLHSSGHAALDHEALALVKRVSPLPPPPAAVIGNPLKLAVPIAFELTH